MIIFVFCCYRLSSVKRTPAIKKTELVIMRKNVLSEKVLSYYPMQVFTSNYYNEPKKLKIRIPQPKPFS